MAFAHSVSANGPVPNRGSLVREARAAAVRARAAQGAVFTSCEALTLAADCGPPLVALLSGGDPPLAATAAFAVAKALSAQCRAQTC